jgi:hypothetical protein
MEDLYKGYRKERRRYQVDMRGYGNANLREITNESIWINNNPEGTKKKTGAPFGPLVEYLRKCGCVR